MNFSYVINIWCSQLVYPQRFQKQIFKMNMIYICYKFNWKRSWVLVERRGRFSFFRKISLEIKIKGIADNGYNNIFVKKCRYLKEREKFKCKTWLLNLLTEFKVRFIAVLKRQVILNVIFITLKKLEVPLWYPLTGQNKNRSNTK